MSVLSGTSLGILIVAPITLKWELLQYLAIAGGVVGAARGYIISRKLTWRQWLRRLEANTPADSLSRLIGAGLLLACGGHNVWPHYLDYDDWVVLGRGWLFAREKKLLSILLVQQIQFLSNVQHFGKRLLP